MKSKIEVKIEGKSREKKFARILDLLGEVIRGDIKNILFSVHFFLIAIDGSQPWKTGTEKELWCSRDVVWVQSVEPLLECIHVDNYKEMPRTWSVLLMFY